MPAQASAPTLFAPAFLPRSEPLTPRAVLALGSTVERLQKRCLALDDGRLRELSGVASDGLLLLLGKDLPWVDGARYLGETPADPDVLVPTDLAPDVPAGVFVRASRLASGINHGPIAVSFVPPLIVSLQAALPVERDILEGLL